MPPDLPRPLGSGSFFTHLCAYLSASAENASPSPPLFYPPPPLLPPLEHPHSQCTRSSVTPGSRSPGPMMSSTTNSLLVTWALASLAYVTASGFENNTRDDSIYARRANHSPIPMITQVQPTSSMPRSSVHVHAVIVCPVRISLLARGPHLRRTRCSQHRRSHMDTFVTQQWRFRRDPRLVGYRGGEWLGRLRHGASALGDEHGPGGNRKGCMYELAYRQPTILAAVKG